MVYREKEAKANKTTCPLVVSSEHLIVRGIGMVWYDRRYIQSRRSKQEAKRDPRCGTLLQPLSPNKSYPTYTTMVDSSTLKGRYLVPLTHVRSGAKHLLGDWLPCGSSLSVTLEKDLHIQVQHL